MQVSKSWGVSEVVQSAKAQPVQTNWGNQAGKGPTYQNISVITEPVIRICNGNEKLNQKRLGRVENI
jgi:hypothetical protein